MKFINNLPQTPVLTGGGGEKGKTSLYIAKPITKILKALKGFWRLLKNLIKII